DGVAAVRAGTDERTTHSATVEATESAAGIAAIPAADATPRSEGDRRRRVAIGRRSVTQPAVEVAAPAEHVAAALDRAGVSVARANGADVGQTHHGHGRGAGGVGAVAERAGAVLAPADR